MDFPVRNYPRGSIFIRKRCLSSAKTSHTTLLQIPGGPTAGRGAAVAPADQGVRGGGGGGGFPPAGLRLSSGGGRGGAIALGGLGDVLRHWNVSLVLRAEGSGRKQVLFSLLN